MESNIQSMLMTLCQWTSTGSQRFPQAERMRCGHVSWRRRGPSSMEVTLGRRVDCQITLLVTLSVCPQKASVINRSSTWTISLTCLRWLIREISRWWLLVMDKVRMRQMKESFQVMPTRLSQSTSFNTMDKKYSCLSWEIHGEQASGKELGQMVHLNGPLRLKN